jgi:hypothetical protein
MTRWAAKRWAAKRWAAKRWAAKRWAAKRWAAVMMAAALAVGTAFGLAAAAVAQQATPLQRGPFGSMEAAFSPKEAVQQLDLLNAALTRLQPQRPGAPDVYVLSLSLWDDPVFEREASATADVLAKRYKAEGRSLVLSAGMKGQARTFPAASPMFFHAALAKIASLMDPSEDALVLFLTSHGNRDGTISFHEERRLRAMMSGRHLRAALDDAGITHRMIIISACFSGAFIRPLASESTIVFTAASSSQSSFGCQPENHWTYFGDAFINQELRSGAPLFTAFEQAKRLIAGWESRDGFEPSNPQRSVGAQIAPLLRALGERAPN